MSSQFQLKLPIIRKIFRQGDHFTCSLCRTKHTSEKDANVCLNQCWFDIHHFDPVVIRRRLRRMVFRCHFCCRDYESDGLARRCAQRCLGEINKLHIQEQLISDLPLPAPQSTVSRMLDNYAEYFRRQALAQQEAKSANKSASKDGQIVELKREPAVADEPVKRGKHKDSFDKKAARKSEKYYCAYCRELHYTRMEAENCFEGHFGEDGYEKVIPA